MLWIERYRPKEFAEIRGQDAVIRHLASFAGRRSVPHLLLVGQHGTGKSSALECLSRQLYGEYWDENTSVFRTGDLFGQGKAYLENEERFAHIYQKDASLIANFKYIVKWYASMRPLDAEFKLMVFEDAEALTFEAQQALRRIMERYSATCRFVFSATRQSGIIPAISSRCLPLFFAPVPDDQVIRQLAAIMERERVPPDAVTGEDLELIAQAARGDLRKAIMFLQLFAEIGHDLNLAELSRSETDAVTQAAFAALRSGDLDRAKQVVESLMIDYGLSGREILQEFREIARREYNHPGIAVAIAASDVRLCHGNNEFIQLNALLAEIIEEVFR
jgi:replication factor C small subunit